MTEADDHVVDLHEIDLVFEEILAGDGTAPDAPAWYGDIARLVAEARVGPVEGELAAEHDVVQAMARIRRIRLTTPADAEETQPAREADPLDDLVERWSTAAMRPDPAAAPPGPAAPGVPGPSMAADPIAGDAPHADAGAPLRGLPSKGDRRPSDAGSQVAPHHNPRHVSGRPRHAAGSAATPAPRPLARVLAAKTAAVTTAVVVGTVAAAAATTGIMSKVVMPALDGQVVKAAMSPWELDDDQAPAVERGRPVPEGVGEDDETVVGTPSCPTLVLVCSPLTPAGEGAPATEPAGTATTPAKSGTGLVSDTTTTTLAPTEPTPATTTTTEPAAPPPTEPAPPTTTTSSTTTTSTPPPTEPGPLSASDSGAQSGP